MSSLTTSAAAPRITGTKLWVNLAMFSAVSLVVTYLSKLIPISVLGFLHFDFKDAIIVISGFLFGFLPAAAVTVVVSFIEMLTMSSTGPIGMLMNVIASAAFACPAAFIYNRNRSMKGAIIGLVTGVVCMTVMMLLWNYLITPLYMETPREVIASMLVPVFLPFNLIKGGLNLALTLIIYKPLANVLRRANLVEAGNTESASTRHIGSIIVGVILLVSFALLALVIAGVI
jgi:riboflavin transporter FmnP